eukprot:scaffold2846_cov322-Pavlova_lutheri.AAC.44
MKVLDSGRHPVVEKNHPDAQYERMKILCLLAAYFVATARTFKTTMKLQRDQAFAMALTYLNQAGLIQTGQQEQMPLVGRGMLQMAKGELPLAKKSFEEASRRRDNGKRNVVGLLGKAQVCCMQGEWGEALACYTDVLMMHPGCPVSVRNGIGLCSMKLGYIKQAEAAFNRVLHLEENNVTALVALAVMRVNEAKSLEGQKKIAKQNEAATLLKWAFESPGGQDDPNVLGNLSFHLLARGDYGTAGGLAAKAFERASDRPKLQAESLYVTACACHAQGMMKEAKQNYMAACDRDPTFPLPFIGLGQMHLHEGESNLKVAAEAFERACKGIPLSSELHAVIGELYHKSGELVKAVEFLKTAINLSPGNADAHRLIGDCYVQSDTKLALQHYERFLKLTENVLDKEKLSTNYVFLLNNTGIMYYKKRQFHSASTAFCSALESLQQSKNLAMDDDWVLDSACIDRVTQKLKPGVQVTIAYNLARAIEESGNFKMAKHLYCSILKCIPGYYDCYFRMAGIFKKLSDFDSALKELQKAESLLATDDVTEEEKVILTDSLMGMRVHLFLDMHKWPETKALLSKMKRKGSERKSQVFPMIAEGNLNFLTTPRSRSNMDEKEKSRIKYHLAKANDYFAMVLKESSNCTYAANGIGLVLLREQKFKEARQAFAAVQEAAVAEDNQALLADALCNLAQAHLLSGDNAIASKLSETILQRFSFGHDESVLLLRAKALYEEGKLLEAKESLQRAIHHRPHDLRLWFDCAHVLQEYGTRTFVREEQKKGLRAKLRDLQLAAQGLDQASSIFQYLRTVYVAAHARFGYNEEALSVHLEHCKRNLVSAREYVSRRKEELALEQTRVEEEQERYERSKQEEEVERARQEQLAKEEHERQELQARQAQEKLEMLKEQWKLQGGGRQAESKRRKRKKGKESATQDLVEEDDVGGGYGLEDAGLVSSDEEEYRDVDGEQTVGERNGGVSAPDEAPAAAEAPPRDLRALGLEDSSDEEWGGAEEAEADRKRKRAASRIEEEEEAPPPPSPS